MTTDLLSIDDLAKTLKIGRNTAYKLMKQEIPSIKIGKRKMVRQQDVNTYINKKFDYFCKN